MVISFGTQTLANNVYIAIGVSAVLGDLPVVCDIAHDGLGSYVQS